MVLGVANKPLATLCSSSWIGVRDLPLAHAEAVYIRPETSNKRFVVCSPEKSNFQQEAEIIDEASLGWGERIVVPPIGPAARTQISLDGSPVAEELGIRYRSSSKCFIPFVKQLYGQMIKEGL